MRSTNNLWVACGLVVVFAAGAEVEAANCALRSPDRQIYEMFPEATSYRTVEANVDAAVKPVIEKALQSEISFSDLGKHTIYVVLQESVPVGFVHARSEIGKYGSVELVWAMDLDLTIRDFRVQRSREKQTKVIKSADFRDRMVDKRLPELQAYLLDNNQRVNVAALGVPGEAAPIAHTVVLCGVKTRLITEIAFGGSIFNARLLGNLHRFFPGTTSVTRVSAPLGDQVLSTVREKTGLTLDQFEKESFTILKALDESGQAEGFLVFSRWSAHPVGPEIWWAVSADGVVRNAIAVGEIEDQTSARIAGCVGKALSELMESSGPADSSPEKCASEVLAVLSVHGIGD